MRALIHIFSSFAHAVISIHDKSWLFPLPDFAHDIKRVLSSHNERILLKQYNRRAALLTEDSQHYPHTSQRDQALTLSHFKKSDDCQFSGSVKVDMLRREGQSYIVDISDRYGGFLRTFAAESATGEGKVKELFEQRVCGNGSSAQLNAYADVVISKFELDGVGRMFVLQSVVLSD
jgi:hypothetical protein